MSRQTRENHPTILRATIAAAALAIVCGGPPAAADSPQSDGTAGSAAPTQPAAAPAADLPEVAVYLKEGERITGLLVSTDSKQIVVRVVGINTRIPVETIERYEVLPPVLERYEELRKSIGNEPEDIVRLAKWLQAREQYPLALTEVNRALAVDKENGEALRLRSILEQLIVLRHAPRNPTPTRPAPEAADPVRPRPDDFPLLSADDINLMRVYEIDLAAKPRVLISRDTIMRLLEANTGHPLVPNTREGRESLARKPAAELLDLMFKLQAREFYREVEVLDQPPSIKLFRDNVERTWLMSCATTQCHGGLDAGRLVLHNRSPNSDPSVYTNLLILERFRTSIGADPPVATRNTGAGSPAQTYGRPLINWDHPERSPLLQLGLPREDSLFRHPRVPRRGASDDARGAQADVWKPEFQSTEDKLFKKTVDWIRSMYRPRPDYTVQYIPIRPFEPPLPAQLAPPAAASEPAGPAKEQPPR